MQYDISGLDPRKVKNNSRKMGETWIKIYAIEF